MIQVIKFILNSIIEFISMLFTIDLGNNLNLGLLMCIAFIFLPMMLRIINFIKQDAIEELDDKYDESRPRNVISSTLTETSNLGNGKKYIYSNQVRVRRRMRK